MERRACGKGRLSDEKLSRLVPRAVLDVLAANPGMGTITIQTTRAGLNGEWILSVRRKKIAEIAAVVSFDP